MAPPRSARTAQGWDVLCNWKTCGGCTQCSGLNQQAWVECGRQGRCSESPRWADPAELHPVRCCSDLEKDPPWRKNKDCSVWAGSEGGGMGDCPGDMTLLKAEALCAAAGGRLCTSGELLDDCSKGTGCGHDNDLVWSGDRASPSKSPPPSPPSPSSPPSRSCRKRISLAVGQVCMDEPTFAGNVGGTDATVACQSMCEADPSCEFASVWTTGWAQPDPPRCPPFCFVKTHHWRAGRVAGGAESTRYTPKSTRCRRRRDYPRTTMGYAFEIDEPAAIRVLTVAQVEGWRCESVCKKDSTEITTEDRESLVMSIRRAPERRIVVTHGTDTMIETAQFVEASGAAVGKSVAFVGAMKPERFKDSDATFNVGVAVGVTDVLPPGSVVVCMGGRAIPAARCMRDLDSGRYYDANRVLA
ncbi:hypothetical protein EMIHUDRAFT_235032 [Emiliania huxleyi CCMP1516]|uniref:L-asparaginase N-terminal domain-containing protein n=2 Tax=Emiliania huxleyi TaxID=2903 RepID=A0A0D3JXL1_EMIH1|nr:hypothetical protein EMIHUDRAFT_235032 [Emiliania huxleyi CCMP1516]EOD28246.1 hypothetical protein EMIHUDRAFT_235032 [Emiliania huxleyi CCMP1516]|eukprot:XP_005780675.1 hypothetical protein EMIHUDRAFT_235032 [Emiliania huxleyi CCMP1516]